MLQIIWPLKPYSFTFRRFIETYKILSFDPELSMTISKFTVWMKVKIRNLLKIYSREVKRSIKKLKSLIFLYDHVETNLYMKDLIVRVLVVFSQYPWNEKGPSPYYKDFSIFFMLCQQTSIRIAWWSHQRRHN